MAGLSALIDRLTDSDGSHASAVAGLTLHRWSQPTSAQCLMQPALCVIAQGQKQVRLAEHSYAYDPTQCLLVAADVPIVSKIITASRATPFLSLSLELDHATVCELVAELEPVRVTITPEPATAITVSALEPALMEAVTRLVALLDAPRDRAVLAPLVLREIAYRLLSGALGGRLRQLFGGDGTTRRVLRTLQWLRTHYAQPVRIEDLAREARLSPSALHQHFKSVTAMSPLQYQKQLRLHEARRLMSIDGLEAAEACFRVGYESPSQFSREYRRLFGAPPRKHVTAERGTPSAAESARG